MQAQTQTQMQAVPLYKRESFKENETESTNQNMLNLFQFCNYETE